MGSKLGPPHADERIAALAARQHGVIHRRQLAKIGLEPGAVAHRVRVGRLHRVHQGVYAVGRRPITREGAWIAAVLACGPGAVLSHRDAAALYELRPSSRSAIDVTVIRTGRVHRPGITVHRSRTLTDAVTTRRHGIAVTTPARTLLDLADVVSPTALDRAFRQAEILRLYDRGALEAALAETPGRRGARAFAKLLDRRIERARTRSDLEILFLDLCRDAGLPLPRCNVQILGYEVDFLWPAERLIVEADSQRFHLTASAFHIDRARDAHLTASGYRVLRFTYRQVTREPAVVAGLLAATRRSR